MALDFEWIRQRPGEDGDEFLLIGKTEQHYLVRYSGIADYIIDLKAGTINWSPHSSSEEDSDSGIHLGKNQVIPMVLSTQNQLVLHASAVVLPTGEAIAFSGPSGFGKSTLANAFAKNPQFEHFADDWITISPESSRVEISAYGDDVVSAIEHPIDAINALPMTTRLNNHQFKTDDLVEFKLSSRRLERIYLISPDTNECSIEIKPLKAKESYVSLARNLFRLDSTDRTNLAAEVQLLTSLLTKTPVYSLSYPRRKRDLPALVRHILEDQSQDN